MDLFFILYPINLIFSEIFWDFNTFERKKKGMFVLVVQTINDIGTCRVEVL